jgi:putative DNA primase/helicase
VQRPDLNQCRAMLVCISAADRETWVRMGMALNAEYPGADGFAVFVSWSESAENYDAKATRATWKSYKPGAVKIGTLIDEAKRCDYLPDRDPSDAPKESVEDIARRQADRADRERADKAATDAKQANAAKAAKTALQDASDTGTSEYLTRKRCGAYGLKFACDGALLVPMTDDVGALHNLQRILPNGEKRFLPGGRKSGLWHWAGSAPTDDAHSGPLLIAEGYATAASLHEACALPCAVAFDCGNLMHVARALRGRYPNATLVVCADDDANNKSKHPDGTNPGLTKARAAAKGIRGAVAVPTGLPEGMTDFNDLAAHAGAPAVKACVDLALSTLVQAKSSLYQSQPIVKEGADRFTVDDTGVYTQIVKHRRGKDGKDEFETYPVRVSLPLWVRARSRNSEGGEWGYWVEFYDPRRKLKHWILPSRMLAGDGTEYRAQLASIGFEPPQDMQSRRFLTEYILTRPIDTFARTVRRIGWHDDRAAFVLPTEVIQPVGGEPYLLQIDGEPDASFRARGALENWRDNVAALAVGNSRLMFAMSCAFAGPLLEPAQQAGIVVHYIGPSSKGKTSAARMAAAVWGGPSFVQTWRATDSAVEWLAASRTDTLLPLDELKEVDSSKIGPMIYMLGNGQGKARSNQGGANRPRHEWRVFIFSTGEISVQDHIRDGGGKVHAGQEVRAVDLPSDAGVGLGVFEALHGEPNGKAFSERINSQTREHYGVAGPAFVRKLQEHADQLGEVVRARVRRTSLEIAPAGASEQVMRVVDRFALVAVAGEMATKAGLTGWKEGDATLAAYTCFISWIDARGGLENREEMEAVAYVRKMIALHGRGRYNAWERSNDSKAPNVPNALGWRRKLSLTGAVVEDHDDNATGDEGREVEYVHERSVFRQEMCNGLDDRFVIGVLKARGYLRCNDGRNTLTVRLPGMAKNKYGLCVVVKSSILADE